MRKEYFRSASLAVPVIALMLLAAFPAQAAHDDLTSLPFEQLLETEVLTASKFARQISDAPSAVTVVTAEDIRTYGYRTLADILNSVRGLHTSYDLTYTYLGGRGFGRPGDYTGRILLLIDGVQANDNIYNQSYFGNEGLLDADMIDRVEYVSGPGSVAYGNNAFFGTVNVITRKGRDLGGVQVAAEVSSHQGRKGRLSYGQQLANGADILLSTSAYASNGQNHYFPEYDNPVTNNGIAHGLDDERNRRFFGKGHYGNWTLEGAYSGRTKDDPTASFSADFNTRPNWYQDRNGFISLKFDDDLGRDLKVSAQAYYGQYQYRNKSLYGGLLWDEANNGRWWGLDGKLVSTVFADHKIVIGGEYRSDYQQDIRFNGVNVYHDMMMASAYLQDEYRIRDNLFLNLSARLDYDHETTHRFSPRVALIYMPLPTTTLKASYSTASRRPNAFERWYDDAETIISNPGLNNERIYASELVLEHQLDPGTRVLGSLYYYHTGDYICSKDFLSIPGATQFINAASNHTKGAELELDRRWDNGLHLRGSYAWQLAQDSDGQAPVNVPRHLAKLNLSSPVIGHALNAGLEVQYVGERMSEQRNAIGGYTLTNLTLTSDRLVPHLDVSFSIRNLFNREYADAAPDYNVQNTLRQDGRSYWLQMIYDFK